MLKTRRQLWITASARGLKSKQLERSIQGFGISIIFTPPSTTLNLSITPLSKCSISTTHKHSTEKQKHDKHSQGDVLPPQWYLQGGANLFASSMCQELRLLKDTSLVISYTKTIAVTPL